MNNETNVKGNPRDMSIYREQAATSRLAKQEAAKNLKQDFVDDLPAWKELASKHGVRLPNYTQPWTETRYLKRVIQKLGVDTKEYLESCGVTTIKQLMQLNPDTPAYMEVGMFLEWHDGKCNNPDEYEHE